MIIRLYGNDILPTRRFINPFIMSNEIAPEVAVVDTPSVEETITPEVATDPNTQPNTAEPADAELSEEELDAAIEAILNDMPSTVVTEPTFFP